MKKLFTVITIAGMFVFFACGPKPLTDKEKSNIDSIEKAWSPRFNEAKKVIDQRYICFVQYEMKKLSKQEFEKITTPLKRKQDSLSGYLGKKQLDSLYKYSRLEGKKILGSINK